MLISLILFQSLLIIGFQIKLASNDIGRYYIIGVLYLVGSDLSHKRVPKVILSMVNTLKTITSGLILD